MSNQIKLSTEARRLLAALEEAEVKDPDGLATFYNALDNDLHSLSAQTTEDDRIAVIEKYLSEIIENLPEMDGVTTDIKHEVARSLFVQLQSNATGSMADLVKLVRTARQKTSGGS